SNQQPWKSRPWRSGEYAGRHTPSFSDRFALGKTGTVLLHSHDGLLSEPSDWPLSRTSPLAGCSILLTIHGSRGLLFSPLIDLEKILLSAIIQIRGKFHDKKRLYARIQRTDIKGMPRGRECCCCRQTA